FYLVTFSCAGPPRHLPSFPTRRSSDLPGGAGSEPLETTGNPGHRRAAAQTYRHAVGAGRAPAGRPGFLPPAEENPLTLFGVDDRSEEHTSELQSRENLVCRLLLEKKKI